MSVHEQLEETSRLIRACEEMRKAESDPSRIEIIRHVTNRMIDKFHGLLHTMETAELLKLTGIDGYARSMAANEAVQRQLEAIVDTPKQEPVASEQEIT